jgi:SAM-dependent methyltransferase
MSDDFYRAFEDKYRGSSDLIKLRLQVYLPFIQPLLHFYPKGQALDLGCGRGEWLELLSEQGFDATGVDLDDGMLQACRKKGAQVENADAVTYMMAQPANSFCVVSGFHIVEHLPFEALKQFVTEAKRLLLPGGILILETPNPENISVGSNSFYLDPTHERPIPPGLLSFLPEYYDFQRYKVLRLQENAELLGELSPKLIQVIDGVSPDYAVVAQTQGSPMLSEALNSVFEEEYGLTLHTLAERYQESIEKRLILIEHNSEKSQTQEQQAQAQLQQALQVAQAAQTQEQQAQAQLQQALQVAQAAQTQEQQTQAELRKVCVEVNHIKVELNSQSQERLNKEKELTALQKELQMLHQANHQHWQLAQKRLQEINALRNSKSWRITAPLRWSMHQVRLLRQHGLKSRLKALARKVLKPFVQLVVARPALLTIATGLAHRLGVADRLKPFARSCVAIPLPAEENPCADKSLSAQKKDLANLSTTARQIYADLNVAIEQQKKG